MSEVLHWMIQIGAFTDVTSIWHISQLGGSVLETNLDFPAFSHVEIGVTSDGNTVVCHHPAVDIPYELTQVSVCPVLQQFS